MANLNYINSNAPKGMVDVEIANADALKKWSKFKDMYIDMPREDFEALRNYENYKIELQSNSFYNAIGGGDGMVFANRDAMIKRERDALPENARNYLDAKADYYKKYHHEPKFNIYNRRMRNVVKSNEAISALPALSAAYKPANMIESNKALNSIKSMFKKLF